MYNLCTYISKLCFEIYLSFATFVSCTDMGNTLKPVTKEETLTIEELLEDYTYTSSLMVYNDDVNTFDWVIESLVTVCKHTHEQAEQCAMYILFKGKYAVKHGSETELIPMQEALLDRGISAKVENL